ncbi:MAG: zinc ABC transporter substrate-binding protein [Actinobacteria bacterium]|nr:zinc ABC transporter substrate-binding protein [Actinomycetota bacterium]
MKDIIRKAMLPRFAWAAAILPALLIAALSWGCGGTRGADSGGRVKVAASIAPLADFVARVGGERVEVELMVPAGASPHTYEPTSRQMRFLSEARLLVLNGLELETWATDILGKVGNSGLVRVETAGAIPTGELIAAGEEEHGPEGEGGGHEGEGREGEEHRHGVYDPHVWLDPALAVYQVQAIRDALVEADPEHAQDYRDNASAFIEELGELDAWIKERVASFTRKRFVAFHPAWAYFAARYGLEMVGVLEELPGKEPSAADIAELVEKIRAAGVTVIFAEPQFNPRVAEAVANASGGGVRVAILDPLGNPDDPAKNTYEKLMRHNVVEMGRALE